MVLRTRRTVAVADRHGGLPAVVILIRGVRLSPSAGLASVISGLGAPGGGLMRVGTGTQGNSRHYAGTVRVTRRTRGGSATAKSRQRRRREQRQVAGGPGERVGAE